MSCSSNDSPKTQNISKETSEKAAQNYRLKKMKEPIVAKPRVDEWERVPKEWLRSHDSLQGVFDKRNGHEEYKSIDIHKSAHAELGSDLHLHENSCDPLDDKFYTDDVIKQVEDIIKSAEKSKHTETIEEALLGAQNRRTEIETKMGENMVATTNSERLGLDVGKGTGGWLVVKASTE
ncbi:hypothetical protein Fot_11431 [Forsythia ovata]|uniref:Uncharacterized protein n=1 Tax=Forsythia ovata TaxID=205694 RepID=A0ABD1WJN3_9LAMI